LLNNPPTLSDISIPVLSNIPVVGDSLFNQTVLVYIMYVSVAVVTFLLFKTRWGLRVRAVGEHPQAADTVGIKVNRMRWQAVLFGGVFAGIGGAYFTIGSTGSFDRGVTGGNGFIALAALIMGRWHPVGATMAALFFGFMWNLQNQLSFTAKIPSDLLGMTPYLATIIAVAGFVGRVRPPAADGEPYVKS
ncbi:MAG: ABC transporter permease, partial [Nocardioidaceae bacterium]